MKPLLTFALFGMILTGVASPAFAESYRHRGHDNDNRRHGYHDYRFNDDRRYHDTRRYYIRETRPDVIIIDNRDRILIRDYYRDDFRRRIPPGHAKRYLIGAPLPLGIRYHPVPRDLYARLSPLPRGYEYIRVDNDVLLVAEASRHVVDAVALLSVINR